MTEHGICAKCKKSVDCSYADDRITGCKKFVLEPELELTNEECFDTLTTKGKAEIIAQLSSYGGNVEAILNWLKEKHDGNT